uniref:Uncharacterized protein n=1 Tax=Anguilla anguilla TaxID=7936 RepID=A0A0E9RTF7_ANGAN
MPNFVPFFTRGQKGYTARCMKLDHFGALYQEKSVYGDNSTMRADISTKPFVGHCSKG